MANTSGPVQAQVVTKVRVIIAPLPSLSSSGNLTGKGQIFPTGRS